MIQTFTIYILHILYLSLIYPLLLFFEFICFSRKLRDRSATNGLTMDRLTTLFGPVLLRPHPDLRIPKEEKEAHQKAYKDAITILITIFLQHHKTLFVVCMCTDHSAYAVTIMIHYSFFSHRSLVNL